MSSPSTHINPERRIQRMSYNLLLKIECKLPVPELGAKYTLNFAYETTIADIISLMGRKLNLSTTDNLELFVAATNVVADRKKKLSSLNLHPGVCLLLFPSLLFVYRLCCVVVLCCSILLIYEVYYSFVVFTCSLFIIVHVANVIVWMVCIACLFVCFVCLFVLSFCLFV
jgi:hypothetical protein